MHDALARLSLERMPELADAMRRSHDRVVARWSQLVEELIPDANELTVQRVRNTIPGILSQMADALESAEPATVSRLLEITRSHGVARFHEHYDMEELILEYRLLRKVLIEEIASHRQGNVSPREWTALEGAVDIALQQAVLAFYDHQKAQLKAATEAEAKFLAFLSHDLRNSLNSILLTMQWAEGSMAAFPELAEELDAMRAAREAAMTTIAGMERLLQAERLRKNVSLKRQRVDLMHLAREMALALPAGGELIAITGTAAAAHAETDPSLVRLILQNLLGNAVKYGQGKPVTLAVDKIEDSQGEGWNISVTDRGVGIAPENIAHLFDAFQRGATHGQPGVGLGLFIASQAARLLGSTLEVESELGKGSRFWFVLRDLPRDTG